MRDIAVPALRYGWCNSRHPFPDYRRPSRGIAGSGTRWYASAVGMWVYITVVGIIVATAFVASIIVEGIVYAPTTPMRRAEGQRTDSERREAIDEIRLTG